MKSTDRVKSLVVGFGSIGQRHARLLQVLGHEVGICSRREINFSKSFNDLGYAVSQLDPSYIVIANRTMEHLDTLRELGNMEFDGAVLVEKPLFSAFEPIPSNSFRCGYVGYHLRFHPLLRRLRRDLVDKKICSYHAYVGQYLPSWRPGTDYRQSYSSRLDQGGGALSDLSHELDYTMWLIGDWRSIAARGGRFSSLDIDSDDCFCILLEAERCPAAMIQVNYLDRKTRREVIVNTDNTTYRVDLINGTYEINEKVEINNVERDVPYTKMHQAILSADNITSQTACTFEHGLDVMRLLEAAREAATSDRWVKR